MVWFFLIFSKIQFKDINDEAKDNIIVNLQKNVKNKWTKIQNFKPKRYSMVDESNCLPSKKNSLKLYKIYL